MREKEYRFTECVMYGYKRDAEKCADLALEIDALRGNGDVQGQNYSADINNHGGVSDPVARHVEKIMKLEHKLKRLLRRVGAVTRLRENLTTENIITITKPRNLLKILDDYYIAKATVSEFLRQTHWGRSAFYMRRRELVMLAGEYLRNSL